MPIFYQQNLPATLKLKELNTLSTIVTIILD